MKAADQSFISSTFWTERIGFVAANKTIDYILAIGGGSVTDTAKAIAAFRDKQEYLTDFVRNKKKSES